MAAIEALLDRLEPGAPRPLGDVLEALREAARIADVKTSHPRYFGLPSASPTSASIAGEALAAALSTQLATFGHAPFAILAERRLVARVARALGMDDAVEGQLTSGGQEANLTAVLLALHRAFPEARSRGVRAIPGPPTLYASAEAHASLRKAARVLGLGDDAVRSIRVGADHRLEVDHLRDRLARDRLAGDRPFLIVATAGTTTAGAIDPLADLADLAAKEHLSLHVDAAWGGLLAFLPEARGALSGIERADTITFDPHKVLHVPLGVGMVLTRWRGALHASYGVGAPYMPRSNARDPYASSLPWSRPFLGLRLLLPLATLGWEAHVDMMRERVRLGVVLRQSLVLAGFRLLAPSPLPVALFLDGTTDDDRTRTSWELVARARTRAGAWVSLARLPSGKRAVRAGIVSNRTTEADVLALVAALRNEGDTQGSR